MKTLALLSLLALAGCTHITVSRTESSGSTNVVFHATSLLSNSTLKGLGVASSTKTTSALLKLTAGATEPNPEAITASAEGLGTLIGTAAATAAKGAKP